MKSTARIPQEKLSLASRHHPPTRLESVVMSAARKQSAKKAAAAKKVTPKKLTWNIEPEPEDEVDAALLGELGVQRAGSTRGRRSLQFPDVNISATARKLGITKSHLSKVLLGVHRPSMDLAIAIADALGKDLYWVASLYKKESRETKSESRPRKKK